jgi:hypothetical protein
MGYLSHTRFRKFTNIDIPHRNISETNDISMYDLSQCKGLHHLMEALCHGLILCQKRVQPHLNAKAML